MLDKPIASKMLRKTSKEARKIPRLHWLMVFQNIQRIGLILKAVLEFRKMLEAGRYKLLVDQVVAGTLAKTGEG